MQAHKNAKMKHEKVRGMLQLTGSRKTLKTKTTDVRAEDRGRPETEARGSIFNKRESQSLRNESLETLNPKP